MQLNLNFLKNHNITLQKEIIKNSDFFSLMQDNNIYTADIGSTVFP